MAPAKPQQAPPPVPAQSQRRKSIVVAPNAEPSNGEEIEIAAQISLPPDGGWGWVVLFGSFTSITILDGAMFTFGSFLSDIQNDFKISGSLVALSNSVGVAIYFMASPVSSALINRFGFRSTTMVGSVICSIALFITHFAKGFPQFFVFYSLFFGFGASLINMSAGLIVGFYFEKLRSLALSISTCGTSVGITVFSPLNSHIVKVAGWRTAMLMQSGLLGIVFYLAMTFKPLLSITVTKYEEDNENPTKTVTILPNLAATGGGTSRSRSDGPAPKTAERLFQAVSNSNFPTAAAVVEEGGLVTTADAGPSTGAVSRLRLTANGPQGGISRRQLKQVQSLISRTNVQDKAKVNIEFEMPKVKSKKQGCCGRCCQWESEVPQSRPMYRDDAFYEGKLENLPAYQKSMMIDTEKTGIEYQLAVSRAVTVNDLQERHGVCTTATRRVLATMVDPTLLKQGSFRMLCTSGFLTYLGILVPYTYLRDRNELAGVDPNHCNYFISAIGAFNALGRFVLGYLATKISPFIVYGSASFMAGLSTALSSLSYSVVYQYCYSASFGFFTSAITSLRSILIVELYGIEKLTSCTGMMCLFLGFGNIISTPLAGIVKENFGYNIAFMMSGTFISISGIIVLLIKRKPKQVTAMPGAVKTNVKNLTIKSSSDSRI